MIAPNHLRTYHFYIIFFLFSNQLELKPIVLEITIANQVSQQNLLQFENTGVN